ncbi:MAG TPA: efflux RND transporter periplasmic adaptor subunit [Rhizomicrobium sp.]|jgi:RND family efflux transporter MFP subunit|nr:efflux RND transporter periplasmic adaptor subunit [Rhizomicrobium sp.]
MTQMRTLSRTLAVAAAAMTFASVASADDAPSVGVVAAHRVMMAPKMQLPGTVVARNDSKLASQVEGRVAWVADVGTVVKTGDVVAKLDSTILAEQFASDQANVRRLQASLRYDQEQASRMQRLVKQNAIATSQRDQAMSLRDVDTAQLAQAQAELAKTKAQLDYSQIRAPFPGRVVARLINAGEYATVGKDIVRLVDIDSIEVKAQAPIEAVRYLREGMPVTVLIQNKAIGTNVRAIVPVGDELSRMIEIRLTLNAGAALVGDAATVLAPSAQPRDVLAIPRDALVLREDNTYIFKVSAKSVAQRIVVQTGAEDGTMIEVKGPVAVGDRVVVRGAERLETGQKVHAAMAS